MTHFYSKLSSPVGPLHIISNGKKITALIFDNGWKDFSKKLKKNNQVEMTAKKDELILKAEKQLKEYFAGARKDFDVPVEFSGTEFQNSCWKSLTKIPFGKTISYGEQAKKINNPKAVRAVGGANGRNRICIIIPCHRVIGQNGSLTGFGGGIKIKEQLLKLENSI